MSSSKRPRWAAPAALAALGLTGACGPAGEDGRTGVDDAIEKPAEAALPAAPRRVERPCQEAIAFARRLGPATSPPPGRPEIAVALSGDEVIVGGELGNVEVREGEPLGPAVRPGTFAVRLDPCGNIEWLRSFGEEGRQSAVDVGTDPVGNVIVSGTFRDSIDLGTGPIPAREGATNVFVAKLRSYDGATLWVKHISAEEGLLVGPYSVATDTSGNALLLAHREAGAVELGDARLPFGNPGALVIKLDPEGHTVWAKALPTGGDESAVDIATSRHNEVFVAGDDARGKGVFVIALSPPGDLLWKRRFWGHGQDSEKFVDLDVNSEDDPLILGTGYLGSVERPGAEDLPFLTELGAWGDPQWIVQRPNLEMDRIAATRSGTTLLSGAGCDNTACGLIVAEVDTFGREEGRRLFAGTEGTEAATVTDMKADRRSRAVIAGRFKGSLALVPQPLERVEAGLFVARVHL
jgi:hypothetical protein